MGVRAFGLSCLTPEQREALIAVGIDPDEVLDTSCTSSSLNTCERDAKELLEQYPIYNPEFGIFTKWGDINLSWDTENLLSDERWQVATYTDEYSYRVGDKVIVIENDGYRLSVYSAISNIPTPAGAFNPSLWSLVCSVTTTEPVGLPDVDGLTEKYEYYNPGKYLTKWKEFQSEWEEDLITPSSDKWSDSRLFKINFYEEGDIVLYDSSTGDFTCVYVAKIDMPSSTVITPNSPPPSEFWSKLYCIRNKNKPESRKHSSYRAKVSLSYPDNDMISVPVESTIAVGPDQ